MLGSGRPGRWGLGAGEEARADPSPVAAWDYPRAGNDGDAERRDSCSALVLPIAGREYRLKRKTRHSFQFFALGV